MDIVRLNIPHEFIHVRTPMTWREILFGLENELLDPSSPPAFALERVTEETDDATLIRLAGLVSSDESWPYVRVLAAGEPEQSKEALKAKWLCIVLAWIYDHRYEYADPLRAVEEVFADFDYPGRIAGFVRYMPMVGPPLATVELNESRLYDRWHDYVQKCLQSYGCRPNAAGLT